MLPVALTANEFEMAIKQSHSFKIDFKINKILEQGAREKTLQGQNASKMYRVVKVKRGRC